MTKSDLKSMVKECLIEILSEGLGGTLQKPQKNSFATQQDVISRLPMQSENRSAPSKKMTATPHLREAVRREAGGNKVMESILADTARTTLATQIAHGDASSMPSASSRQGIAQQEQIYGTPEQVFGEDVTSKWANLAFMDSPAKK